MADSSFWLKLILGVGVGITSVAGIAYVHLDTKKRKRFEDNIEMINCQPFLDNKNESHRPLIDVSTELIQMLKNSVISKNNDYRLKPQYPISLDMLVRSTYEQSIKLFIKVNKVKLPKDHGLAYLEKALIKYFDDNDHYPEIRTCLEKTMDLEMRRKTNETTHNPNVNKSVAPILEDDVSMFRFVNLVMRDAAAKNIS